MAGRIRSIKPEVLEDEPAAALSDAAWRLWVSSWLLADDHGRFRAGAKYLAANVWQDTGRADAAEAALAELVRTKFVRVYEVDGQRYAEIKPEGWRRHQRIDHPGKPRIPGPPDINDLGNNPREDSRDIPSATDNAPRVSETFAPRARAQDLVGGRRSEVGGRGPDPEARPVSLPQSDARADPVVAADPADLIALAGVLAAEGLPFARTIVDRVASGRRPSPNQLEALRRIRDERAAAPPARAPPHRGSTAQQCPASNDFFKAGKEY